MPAAGGGIAILDSEAKTKVHGIKLATFTDWKTIKCELTDDTSSVNWKLYAFDETYFKIKPKKRADAQKWYLVKSGTANQKTFNIDLKYEAHINLVYSLVSHDPASDADPDMKDLDKTVTVGLEKLYDSAKFKQYYDSYSGDLGVTYSKTSTTFNVWSPVSANMTVLLYDSDTSKEYGGEDKYTGYHMHYKSGGLWELTIDGDLAGKYYNYQVDNTLGTNVVMDPYATSAGCCGVRGFIYDKATSNPEGWDALPLKWDGVSGYDLATPQDLTIYEVHMQDFTGDESWISNNNIKRGTYNAFVESGTKLTVDGVTVSTGYDHLNELGVGAVQLVPVFDHDNDEYGVFDEQGNPTLQVKYNWGYNPLNYNVVEGGYSSNPHDG
jgi:pullulanase